MEKRIYSQPMTKIMSFEVSGAVCDDPILVSGENPEPGPGPIYGAIEPIIEPESPLF